MFYPVTNDVRYQIALEWCGYDRPRWVARFCGDWIGQSIARSSAAILCVGHNQARMGAAIISEMRV